MKNYLLRWGGLFVFALLILSFVQPKLMMTNHELLRIHNTTITRNALIDTSLNKIKTINDYIKKLKFEGIVVYKGSVLNANDSLLFKNAAELPIHSCTVLHKPIVDSIIKYGLDAKKGLILID